MGNETEQYLREVKTLHKSGIATEHSYRGALQILIELLAPGIKATNEPKRQECGAPDYIITKKDIPLGFIEAKDLGADLNKVEKSSQLKRYKESLENLILTDYLEFRLFQHSNKVATVKIASINGNLKAIKENFQIFEDFIKDFCSPKVQTIKSAEKLAKMMAGKARLMQEVIFKSLNSDNGESNTLRDQLEAFQKILIHDMDEESFSDIYAQTIAYGLFAARLHDLTLEDFSRQEAMFLVPKSNPFLRLLFTYIAGPDLDDRVVWIVDSLADVFRACDVSSLLKDFGKTTQQNDPMINFYETFLAEYNPKLRKSRGVYYTPEPVVNFIVRAVDDILKTEFNLPDGLADTSKVKLKVDKQGMKYEKEFHKVQILDPAAGTGTFLSEIIKHIYKKFENQQGVWSNYVEEHLIPRLHGFEILMASYAMCHLKLELLLKDTGFTSKKDQRLNVYLTNSLEEPHEYTGTLFASWLSKEATAANRIKNNFPIMVVLGNPPYANFGRMNKGDWILGLIEDYKKGLNEKKINIDDDYIKFIRYSEHYIENNKYGIVAMITNNSFIDGVTHRKMREHLLETFDKIYILDLHGSSKKKEKSPDGSKDENVFDITQGVSINIFIKKHQKSKNLAQVYHHDLYGLRLSKYHNLWNNKIKIDDWTKINYRKPYYFFTPKDFNKIEIYEKGFSLPVLFVEYVSGFQTKRDKVTIKFNDTEIKKIISDFRNLEIEEIRYKYALPEDGRDWKIKWAKDDLNSNDVKLKNIFYRPFDVRMTAFTGKSKGFIAYPREKMDQHLKHKENTSLITCRQQSTFPFQHAFISNQISDMCNISSQTKETGYIFPLYLYKDKESGLFDESKKSRETNFDKIKIQQIEFRLKLKFEAEKSGEDGRFAPIDLLDYIYAVLHSPNYREKYKEFLKIDFPRIPYPEDQQIFWKLVEKGGKLRRLHLMESPLLNQLITSYPETGDNLVEKVFFEGDEIGKVWINKSQYFDKVPRTSWEFYIGGYQPCQKWLKDRKGRQLSFDDIFHYQKIVIALKETDRIMKEIDKIVEF